MVGVVQVAPQFDRELKTMRQRGEKEVRINFMRLIMLCRDFVHPQGGRKLGQFACMHVAFTLNVAPLGEAVSHLLPGALIEYATSVCLISHLSSVYRTAELICGPGV